MSALRALFNDSLAWSAVLAQTFNLLLQKYTDGGGPTWYGIHQSVLTKRKINNNTVKQYSRLHVLSCSVWEHWPDTPKYITWTNALQNRCYMCIQWTSVLYFVVITWQSNPPISQFNMSGQYVYTIVIYKQLK